MYDWLGVDKTEIAVVAELLLRGEQTLGELRARASRMEPIPGLTELKPVLQSLIDKKLVVPLTPEGRGQLVTHGLYSEAEMVQVKARADVHTASISSPATTSSAAGPRVRQEDFERLQSELAELRGEVSDLREKLEQLQQALLER
jgi:uncharacterized protein YceH (UPF0502 family)